MDFDIEKTAELARLRLTSEEKEKLAADLNAILKYVEKLRSLNTDEVEPTSHVLDMENVFRKDEVAASCAIRSLLEHAPARQETFFKVPKVVEK